MQHYNLAMVVVIFKASVEISFHFVISDSMMNTWNFMMWDSRSQLEFADNNNNKNVRNISRTNIAHKYVNSITAITYR